MIFTARRTSLPAVFLFKLTFLPQPVRFPYIGQVFSDCSRALLYSFADHTKSADLKSSIISFSCSQEELVSIYSCRFFRKKQSTQKRTPFVLSIHRMQELVYLFRKAVRVILIVAETIVIMSIVEVCRCYISNAFSSSVSCNIVS